jgi:hypothetical protein
MRNSLLFAGVLVVMLTACSSVPVAPKVAASTPQTTEQNPTFVSGQQWTYRRIDLWKGDEVERFTQLLTTPLGAEWGVLWTIESSSDVARVGTTEERFFAATHGFGDSRMTGRHVPLQFPLGVGKSWSFSYKFQSKPQTSVDVKQTATVTGWETVKVPAGTFKALKIEHAGTYTATEGANQWSGRITEVYWYAPAAQRVVAQEYRDTTGTGKIWDQRRDELVSMRK